MVIEGEVTGLLRARSVDPNGFDSSKKRTFYTVANQVSLALERAIVQRQTERAHLASLAESLSDGIVLVDADLRVTSLNQAAHDHLSSLADVRLAEGATLTDTTLAKLAEQALTSGEPTTLQELPTRAVSPERRYLVAMAAPLAGSREGSAAVVILRDVTEERLMQERLLQSEKMVSVGQLVSGVAHELNNPLTGIMGFAQLLLAREELDDRTRNDVQTIYTEADRAAKIVQNLLSFARRKRTEKESANLNVLLERVLELRSYDLRVKNIEVELDLDPNLPQTMVDTNQIQQVFFNIIINAEQAMMSEEGRGTLKVRSWRQQDAIRLSLQDDGPGIDDETLRRIFDPFFTTKQAGEGTGLGLTISYGIIDEHGGRIWAESRPGHGTAFIIELPIVQGSERPRAAPEEELSTATGGSILVVDDEESIQRLLGSILEMDGHQVDTARNGIEALERIGRGHYDVLITDIKMPDMDGRALYQRLLELDNDLAQRTVFITGDTVSPDTRDFLDQVRNPCLAKPFRIRQVRETISQILPNGS
ncbi:MAG: response regulator [Chloroflexi bacterium]|nr:response regulator [Chloroflexota bacterium]